MDPRAGVLRAICVRVIVIRSSKTQALTKKSLSAKSAICNIRRDLRDFNVLCLCFHDNIYSPYFWFSHVNLDVRNNNLLVLITDIKLKSMWPKYGIWDYSIYCLLVTKRPSVYSFICCSVQAYPNPSAKPSLPSTEHTETLFWFCSLFSFFCWGYCWCWRNHQNVT